MSATSQGRSESTRFVQELSSLFEGRLGSESILVAVRHLLSQDGSSTVLSNPRLPDPGAFKRHYGHAPITRARPQDKDTPTTTLASWEPHDSQAWGEDFSSQGFDLGACDSALSHPDSLRRYPVLRSTQIQSKVREDICGSC